MCASNQVFDYFLVLDFEATCEDGHVIQPQEIIEFPVLKIDCKSLEVVSEFHRYVKPRVNQQLTEFCKKLTGIQQDWLDNEPHLEDILQMFYVWMETEGLLVDGVKFIFITCGDWDLKNMLPKQAKHFGFQYPDYLKKWINIKKTFHKEVGVYPKENDLPQMLQLLGLDLEGRYHSGIDDCKNISRIVKTLAQRGCVFRQNGQL